jgi:hypothetical protein
MKKLAIVGSHPDSRGLAPYDDPNYEIWVFNEATQTDWCKRWDASFQMHLPKLYRSLENYSNKKHWEWLQQKRGKPIYMQEVDPEVPDSVKYPLESILTWNPRAQLTSTPSMALALGIYLGYENIHTWGVTIISNTEYNYQAPGWRYWVSYADGYGVKLQLHSGNEMFESKLYGYEGDPTIDNEYFQKRIALLDEAWHKSDNELYKIKNHMDAAMIANKPDELAELVVKCQDTALACGEAAGALGEAEKFSKRKDPIHRQEFERTTAQASIDGEEKRRLMWHAGGKSEYVWNVWKQTLRNEALSQLRISVKEQIKLAYDTGALHGACLETRLYIDELDNLIQAAGGQKALAVLDLM